MHFKYRNVNDAFRRIVEGIHSGSVPTEVLPSRVGEVAAVEEPVILTYSHPRERVLFNRGRDANPAFMMYEALHMLAGRNDIASLEYYSSSYAMQVRDGQGSTANAAYGYRWRKATTWDGDRYEDEETMDQLKFLIDHLRRKPESRRAVLAMWNVKDDLVNIEKSKDVACNLNVCFAVETGMKRDLTTTGEGGFEIHDVPRYLNMTVFNRSNDLIWGALGANYVHFTILQEYIAAHLGLDVGVYNQVSNNLHVYTERFAAEKWLSEYAPKHYCSDCRQYPLRSYITQTLCDGCGALDNFCRPVFWEDLYATYTPFPLVSDPAQFDAELPYIVEKHRSHEEAAVWSKEWKEPFFAKVAEPMFNAFHCHKNRAYDEAVGWVNRIEAEDWRAATLDWILKRKERYEHRVSSRPE